MSAETASKPCTKCGVDKSLGAYHKSTSSGRLHAWCKDCRNAARKVRYRDGREQELANARRHLWARYGLSPDDYERRLEAQGGVCAVCGRPPAEGGVLNVDHCHRTGEVRELLCAGCNKALGGAKDDPAILRALADYIERHAARELDLTVPVL